MHVNHQYTAAESRALEAHYIAGYIMEFGGTRGGGSPADKPKTGATGSAARQAAVERRKNILVMAERPITALDVMEQLGCTKFQANKALKNLEDSGKLVKTARASQYAVYNLAGRKP